MIKKLDFIGWLNDNYPTVMAIANDIGYEEVFRFQLRNKLNKNVLFNGIEVQEIEKNFNILM